MGFLQQDTNNIILDAVLTNEGRKRLAANDGSFRVVAFSLGDDEVDYGVIKRFGRAVGREKVEKNTPVLEALTNGNLELRNRLITVSNQDLFALMTFTLSSDILTFNNVTGNQGQNQQTITVTEQGVGGDGQIPAEIQDTVLIVSLDNRFLNTAGTPYQTVDNVSYYNVVVQAGGQTATQSQFTVPFTPKVLTTQDFTIFGNSANKTQITTHVRIQGRQSGLTKDLTVNLNKTT